MNMTQEKIIDPRPAIADDNIPDLGARTIDELIYRSAARHPQATALTAMGAKLSYANLVLNIDAFATWLKGQGLQPGARVAVALPNVMAHPIACLGIMRAGLTVVCVNPLYTAQELSGLFRDAEVQAVVLFAPLAHTFLPALKDNGIQVTVVVSPGDCLGWRGPIVNWVARRRLRATGQEIVPIPGAVSWKAALSEVSSSAAPLQKAPANQAATMLYSGGTTGRPKGVPMTHEVLVFNVAQQAAALKTHLQDVEENDYSLLLAVPLYHILGLGNLMFSLARGGKTALVMNPRDMAAFTKEWKRHNVTSFPGVNTLFNSLLASEPFSQLDFSSLKLCIGGGMPVSETTAKRWHEMTGCHITEVYGMTETGMVCRNPPGQSRPGSVGLPVPGVEISLRDDDCQETATGPGEICLRGPAVMDGYWNHPQENAAAFTPDGFFRTGDIGVFDTDGFLRLVDRKKEMIISSGFKIFPSEIERILNAHPGVVESAVVPLRDERAGEVPIAYVVRRDPSLDAATLAAFCESHLAGYKRPRKIIFREDLPKSNVGKILRKKLVEASESRAGGQPPGGAGEGACSTR